LCLALSHELKNDLLALSGFFELIEGMPGIPSNAGRLAKRGFDLSQGAARLMRTVAGAMIEDSQAVLMTERERVADVVRRAVETVHLRLGPSGPAPSWDGQPGDCAGFTDRPFLLEIVVTNLLHNAALATPRGAGPPSVMVKDGPGGIWSVTVADHGGGLPEGARRVLLGEPGAVTEVDLEGRAGRWGLGLLLVRASSIAGGWSIEVAQRGADGPDTRITVQGGSPAR
jgi:signal transduction histidine kinase